MNTKTHSQYDTIKHALQSGTLPIERVMADYQIKYLAQGASSLVFNLIPKINGIKPLILSIVAQEVTDVDDSAKQIYPATYIDGIIMFSCNTILDNNGSPHLVALYANIEQPRNHKIWPSFRKFCNNADEIEKLNDIMAYGGIIRVVEFSSGDMLFRQINITQEQIFIVQWQVIYTLIALNETNPGFTHNDLHGGNVLIEVGKKKVVAYAFEGKEIKIRSGLSAKVIDFDFAFTDKIKNKKINMLADKQGDYEYDKTGLSSDNDILYTIIMFLFLLNSVNLLRDVYTEGLFMEVFGNAGISILSNRKYQGRLIKSLIDNTDMRKLRNTFCPKKYLLNLTKNFPHIFHSS